MTPAPKVASLAIATTVLYLGLAVLGRGGLTAFFSNAALTTVAVATLAMTVVALFSAGNLSPGEREDRGNRWVIAAFGVIGLLAAYLPAYTDRKDIWTLDGETLRWIGVTLFIAGGALRLWPVFTGLCGLAQNYHQLLAARALMGFGFGGEWTAGAVLIGEVIRARDRGKAVGLVQSGWAIGWGLSALLYAVLFSALPAELAWRGLFLIGLLPALLVVVIRRFVKEPEVYEREKATQASASDAPRLTEIFAPQLLSTTLRAALLTTGAQGGYYAITTWLPTFLKTERHLTVMGTGGYLATIIVGSWIGYLTSAYLTDRLGRKPNFILFALGSMIIAFAYTSLHLTNASMLWLGFPLGFFASGIFSGIGAFLTELFPTRVRGSGQGFCYNVGRAFGALFPFLIGALSKHYGLGLSIGIFAVAAYGVLIVAALTLPETRGRELEAR